jgi:hypothetical protein
MSSLFAGAIYSGSLLYLVDFKWIFFDIAVILNSLVRRLGDNVAYLCSPVSVY